jgi:hypothetical protein
VPLTQQELDRFHEFVSARLSNGFALLSLEDTLCEFREYQTEVASLNAALRESAEEARQGKCGPLDPERLKAEIREELAREGIVD